MACDARHPKSGSWGWAVEPTLGHSQPQPPAIRPPGELAQYGRVLAALADQGSTSNTHKSVHNCL